MVFGAESTAFGCVRNLAIYKELTRAAKMVNSGMRRGRHTVRTKILHAGIFDSAVNPPADPKTGGQIHATKRLSASGAEKYRHASEKVQILAAGKTNPPIIFAAVLAPQIWVKFGDKKNIRDST